MATERCALTCFFDGGECTDAPRAIPTRMRELELELERLHLAITNFCGMLWHWPFLVSMCTGVGGGTYKMVGVAR